MIELRALGRLALRGGQDWWEEILQRIADSDAFLAIISRAALNSTACDVNSTGPKHSASRSYPSRSNPPPPFRPLRRAANN